MTGTIETLSPYPQGAIHRMKFTPLVEHAPLGLNFRRFGEGDGRTTGVLVGGLHIDPDHDPNLAALLRQRAQHAVIMLFIPDIGAKTVPLLKKWSKFVDLFVLPTPEMQKLTQLFTERPVEVLLDPIDFGFTESFVKPAAPPATLKVAWFGFPDSYHKSMGAHEPLLLGLHEKKLIEYHIVSKHNLTGEQRCILHHYDPETFPALLQTFDMCVLSHVPADFDINTYCKSENKAVLAINRGVPVIASRTPAYERLLTQCGLEEYLFTSNSQLLSAIDRLRSLDEQKRYLQRSQPYVLANYTSQILVRDWADMYQRARARKFPAKA